MSEIINDKKVFTLRDIAVSIQRVIAERASQTYWIKAEMNKLNHYTHSGHCYPELVEKRDGQVVAQMRANLWRNDYLRINELFLQVLKEPLRDGITILFCARVEFHPVHGMSLQISDIDPVFSLGELEKEKQESISRLKKEGLYDLNKKRPFPLLPQRMAIISVETSKGYADFRKVIDKNNWGYCFFNMLFPALLQGDKSVPSIIGQLNNIRKVIHHFDVVAIIRGGGGDVGLSSYDNYELCKTIATFPLPVLTGIGHSTNETVSEMVAYRNAITPTELADFLIQHFHDFAVPVQRAEERITAHAKQMLLEENTKFRNVVRYLRSVTQNHLLKNQNELHRFSQTLVSEAQYVIRHEKELQLQVQAAIGKRTLQLLQLKKAAVIQQFERLQKETQLFVQAQKNKLDTTETSVRLLHPENILKRGYSITLFKGKALKSTRELKSGDEITTILEAGTLKSTLSQINAKEKND